MTKEDERRVCEMLTLTLTTAGIQDPRSGRAAAAVLVKREGTVIKTAAAVIGQESEWIASYLAVRWALRYLHRSGVRTPGEGIMIESDSKAVVEHVCGHWQLDDPRAEQLYLEVRGLLDALKPQITLRNIPVESNRVARTLCEQALGRTCDRV